MAHETVLPDSKIMRYLLDTNILIYFLNQRDPRAAAYILEGQSLISVLTRLELFFGASSEEKGDIRNLLKLIHAIPIMDGIADLAADLMTRIPRFRKKYPDALIAATCLYHQLTLVTADSRDFRNIPELQVVSF